jgi:hypothetical protein
MVSAVLNNFDSIFALMNGIYDLSTASYAVIKNNRRTVLENLNLTRTALSALGSLVLSCSEAGSFFLIGKKISAYVRDLLMVPRVFSASSQIFQKGITMAAKVEDKTANSFDLLNLVGEICYQGSVTAVQTNRVYDNFIANSIKKIPITLPRSLGEYLKSRGIIPENFIYGAQIFNFFYLKRAELARCAASFANFGYCLYRKLRPLPHDPRASSSVSLGAQTSTQTPNQQTIDARSSIVAMQDAKRTFLTQLAARMQLHPTKIEKFIMDCFIEKRLEKFICPITHRVISWPLKHTVSGTLFEKDCIERVLAQHPHFKFRLNGVDHDITRESLTESPEDREQIAFALRGVLFGIQTQLFDRLSKTSQTRKSFQDLKSYVWIQLQNETDTLLAQMLSEEYWMIDPRQWIIEICKKILISVIDEQKNLFEQPKNPKELLEKLTYLRTTTIPGYLGHFNSFTYFSPLTSVKQTLERMPAKVSQISKVVVLESVPRNQQNSQFCGEIY